MKQGTTSRKPMLTIVLLLVATLGALVGNVIYVFQKASSDQAALQVTANMRASAYRVVGLSREATAGQTDSFASLRTEMDLMGQNWRRLQSNLQDEVSAAELNAFGSEVEKTINNAETIIAEQDKVIFLNEVAATLDQTLPQLQQGHTQVVEILLENNAPADQVAVAQNQTWLAERIRRNVDKMLAGGADAEAAADQFNRDANLFGRVLDGMRKGDAALGISRVSNKTARASLENIAKRFEFVNSSIQEIFEATPALYAARQATNNILEGSPALLEQISSLSQTITNLQDLRVVNNQTALVLVAIAIVLGALIGWLSYASTRNSLKETAETNDKNQEAILRLLDEIADLGDGDLTSHATVTEDFTGAIADSINYAIDQLRILVAQIQDTSENVSAAANETRATAMRLSDSASHQSEQIAGVTRSINEMATSINQVSENAAKSTQVAEQSVSIAGRGAEVVRDAITGMDTIREQIQDTSKRIKRLGESSQEIGDIVSLINDIADQTNILALNAAIQASMAGDAGRGFAVVADEVQRLAERSADATKQIGSLVKTIQNDTNDAVTSMEQTTTQVVKGASLTQNAGVALEEIETVSANLEKLIQDISVAAKNQSATAGEISNNMAVIQDITSQTLLGTQATAKSTGELADLAVTLRDSVSGFKLPAANDKFAGHIDDDDEYPIDELVAPAEESLAMEPVRETSRAAGENSTQDIPTLSTSDIADEEALQGYMADTGRTPEPRSEKTRDSASAMLEEAQSLEEELKSIGGEFEEDTEALASVDISDLETELLNDNDSALFETDAEYNDDRDADALLSSMDVDELEAELLSEDFEDLDTGKTTSKETA